MGRAISVLRVRILRVRMTSFGLQIPIVLPLDVPFIQMRKQLRQKLRIPALRISNINKNTDMIIQFNMIPLFTLWWKMKR